MNILGISNLINLTKLNISNNNISNNELKFLISKNFKNLIELDLSNNILIDDNGIPYFKKTLFSNLKILNMEYIPLTFKGLDYLIDLPFSKVIENLSLYLSFRIKLHDVNKITEKLESNLKNLKSLTYIREKFDSLKFNLMGSYDINKEVFNCISNSKVNNLASIGFDFYTKTLITKLKLKVKLTFLITTGLERFRVMSKTYYKGVISRYDLFFKIL